MLYLFFGDDNIKRNAGAQKIIAGLRAKDPGLLVHDIEAGQFSLDLCREHIYSQGFFSEASAILCRGVLEARENDEVLLECAEELAGSKNYFIFVETKKPKSFSAFKKYAAKTEGYSVMKRKDASLFVLSDAVARKDKKNAWILFQKACFADTAPEQIFGLVFWQVKNMLMVKTAEYEKKEAELSLSPFVLGKAKSFSKKYSLKELQVLSAFLLGMYHESHMGGEELGASLERLILTL